ncbi:hypothetical protein B296_00008270 [Ensete ventricosum]|uniref:Uncharacterized protein n=1 Tax=Ensete ventricosum TaxID=4639 RepID=A0A427A596_ENSVE|nr:hypothetical protein B296_00008270 [Ensete ventricosum]
MSVVVVSLSDVSGDSGTADALVVIWSFFNVESTVTTHQLVEVRKNYFIPPEYELYVPLPGERPYDAFLFPTEWTSRTVNRSILVLSTDETELMFNLDKMKSGIGASSGSVAASATSTLTAVDVGASTIEKCPSSGAGAGLRKRLRKAIVEQLADASGSTARTSAYKGKGIVELEEVPEQGYTMRELCEVGDRAGVDKYFTSIITRFRCVNSANPLVPRWSTISGSSQLWIEGPLSGEYLRGALHSILAKQVYECSSEELMNQAGKLTVWSQHEKILTLRAINKELKARVGQELVAVTERRAKELEDIVKKMRTELESLRSQRRDLEQEIRVLRSMFLEVKLKAKGPKAVTAYKASRGFELGLEKMERVSYEFGYRVTLERLRGKYPEITIEWDPFAECPEDANVEMDLDQPFDDDIPSEKQPTV